MLRPMASDVFGLVGTTIKEQYRLDAVIGEGGFGVVYQGFHLSFEHPIAVKCLKLPHHFTAEAQKLFLEKFREEGKMLSKLSDHPSVVRVFDFGITKSGTGSSVPYLVLEWLDGKELGQVLTERGEPFTEEEALHLLRPAMEAIALAHSLGIAHRDLKPANLMVAKTPRGQMLKVLDFGIAKAMQDGETATQLATQTSSGFHAFSPQYAAPEQFRPKKFGPTGPWTDVHALGLILVELVTGKPALEGEEDADFLIASTGAPRPTPRARGGSVTDGFEHLCATALAMVPTDRFADGSAMIADLDQGVTTDAQVQGTGTVMGGPLGSTGTVMGRPGAVTTPGSVTVPGSVRLGATSPEELPSAGAAKVVAIVRAWGTRTFGQANPHRKRNIIITTGFVALAILGGVYTAARGPYREYVAEREALQRKAELASRASSVKAKHNSNLVSVASSAAASKSGNIRAFKLDRLAITFEDFRVCVVDGGCPEPSLRDGYNLRGFWIDATSFRSSLVENLDSQKIEAFCSWLNARPAIDGEVALAATQEIVENPYLGSKYCAKDDPEGVAAEARSLSDAQPKAERIKADLFGKDIDCKLSDQSYKCRVNDSQSFKTLRIASTDIVQGELVYQVEMSFESCARRSYSSDPQPVPCSGAIKLEYERDGLKWRPAASYRYVKGELTGTAPEGKAR